MTESKVQSIIASMYDDRVPLHKLLDLAPDFSTPKIRIAVLLFSRSPNTKEESEAMEAEALNYVDLLIMADILKLVDAEKQVVAAGPAFSEFQKELREYLDSDNIIIRTLGISRQDFDKLVSEYIRISKDAKDIDSILTAWVDLSTETRLGIIRGILIQRSIMGGILMDLKNRNQNTLLYTSQTNKFIDSVLGVPNEQPHNK